MGAPEKLGLIPKSANFLDLTSIKINSKPNPKSPPPVIRVPPIELDSGKPIDSKVSKIDYSPCTALVMGFLSDSNENYCLPDKNLLRECK